MENRNSNNLNSTGNDRQAEIDAYLKGHKEGDAAATRHLAVAYINGDGVVQDTERGEKLLKEASKRGDVRAEAIYAKQMFEKNDIEEGVFWVKKAIAHHDIIGEMLYAALLYDGIGVQQNLKESFKWTEIAATTHDDEDPEILALAQNELGLSYDSKQDYEKAFAWFSKAAENGCAEAQRHLGEKYYFEQGTEKDIDKAIYWFEKAAQQEDEIAQQYLPVVQLIKLGTDNSAETDTRGINIDKINADESTKVALKNINTFFDLDEYIRADDVAEELIKSQPTSPIGWFAKAAVISENFEAKSYGDAEFVDKCKLYEKNIQNALKMASGKTEEYISEKHKVFEEGCVKCTEGGIVNMLTLALDVNKTEVSKTTQGLRSLLGGVYDELRECINFALLKDQNNLIIDLFNAVLHVNHINHKNAENGNSFITKETVEEALDLMGVKPRQSTSYLEDTYISVILYLCSFLNINPGNIQKYYSEEKIKELEEQKRIEEERRKEEERRRQEEQKRKLEELKKLRRKKTITKLVIAAVLICVCLLLVKPIMNGLDSLKKDIDSSNYLDDESTTEITEETEEEFYYLIADDCGGIHIRTGPGKEHSSIIILRDRSLRMYPTGETSGDWIQIETDEYGVAWVNKDVVKLIEE